MTGFVELPPAHLFQDELSLLVLLALLVCHLQLTQSLVGQGVAVASLGLPWWHASCLPVEHGSLDRRPPAPLRMHALTSYFQPSTQLHVMQ